MSGQHLHIPDTADHVSLPQPTDSSQLHATGEEPDATVGQVRWFWLALCFVVVGFVIACGVHWALSHPFGTGYDETKYVNQMNYDRQRLTNEGVASYVGGFFTDDPMRPPAYRLFAAPTSWFVEPTPAPLRLTGIAVFLLTLGLVFGIGQRVGGVTCGAITTTLVAACPIVAGPTFRFGTEYPLVLGIATCVYFLARAWNKPRAGTLDWIGLGVGLAIGVLAKPSFFTIAGPVAVLVLLVRWRGWVQGPSFGWLMRAGVLGAALSVPWYARNGLETARMVRRAQQFVRGEIHTMQEYLYVMLNDVYALPLFVILLLTAAGVVVYGRRFTRTPQLRPTLLFLGVLLMAAMPLHLAHMFASSNQNPRFLAPSTLLVLIVAGTLIVLLQWDRRRVPMALLCALIALQLAALGAPSFSMERPMAAKKPIYDRPMYFNSTFPQWDWSVLADYCRARHIEVDRVGLLGLGLPMSRPQIQYPWVRRGARVRVDPLWRFTDGPFEMAEVVRAAKGADLVITAPGYHGAHHDNNPADNAHNAAFAERMRRETSYTQVRDLPIDPSGEQAVHVFIRRSATARTGGSD
ncbi:MAG: ArnT family glycosyltransferase [Phycisphaeraceae bacterium]